MQFKQCFFANPWANTITWANNITRANTIMWANTITRTDNITQANTMTCVFFGNGAAAAGAAAGGITYSWSWILMNENPLMLCIGISLAKTVPTIGE